MHILSLLPPACLCKRIFINNCGIRIGGSRRLLNLRVCCWPQCPSVPDLVPGWYVGKLGTHFKAHRSFSFYRSLLCACIAVKMFEVLGKKKLVVFVCKTAEVSVILTASVVLIMWLSNRAFPSKASNKNKCKKLVLRSLSSECAEGQLRNLTSWWCWRQRVAF